MKRFFLLFVIVFSFNSIVFASHYMGGEITWTCVGGQYIFKMKVYRECAGITMGPNENLTVTNCSGLTTIPMSRTSQLDISPVCNSDPSFPHITCAGAQSSGNPGTGAVEENIYESGLVTLNGVPPASGWIFSWSSCCRNTSNILNSSSIGYTLRAIMYSYNGQNANPCFDSTPTFAETPPTVLPIGSPYVFNLNGYDIDSDSLVYSWAPPLDDANNPCTYSSPYNYNNPLPGLVNVPPYVNGINPNTGEIKYNTLTTGVFVFVVKVSAYKCQVKVAEILNEMQVILTNTLGSNNPPTFAAPFADPNTGIYTSYTDTVIAGDLVCFPLLASDFEMLPNGNQQSIGISAYGSQFGMGFSSSTTGCINPPCATLNPPPPISAQFGVSTDFCWQTTCDHLYLNGCNSASSTFNFYFYASDDFCPIPGTEFKTITIVVLPKPVLNIPDVKCAIVALNGDVTISWVPPIDSLGTFSDYRIYASTNASGPYVEIDSLFNINTSSYTQNNFSLLGGGNANYNSIYYYIKTTSTCSNHIFYGISDTIRTIYLDVANAGGGLVDLSWNGTSYPNSQSTLNMYYIYRECPAGVWSIIDSTTNNFYSVSNVFPCDTLDYRIEISDTLGCTSISNNAKLIYTGISDFKSNSFNLNLYPNPLINSTTIEYDISSKSAVKLSVLNLLGEEISVLSDEIQSKGKHQFYLVNNKCFVAGMYYIKLEVEGKNSFLKMIITK